MSRTMIQMSFGLMLALAISGLVMATVYVPTDLGDLPGGDDESSGNAINASGQVVGIGYVAAGQHGFLWSNGVMTDVGHFPGERDFSVARGINANGQVVGVSDISGNARGFLWANGVMTDLGDLDVLDFGGASACGINDNGQVVGYSTDDAFDIYPFLWQNGVMTSLGKLPGASMEVDASSWAHGINNNGQVVGSCEFSNGDHAFLWQNGTMTALAALPGGDGTGEAYAINDGGKIVGVSRGPTDDRPVLWQNGTITDLGDLPGEDPDGRAHDINSAGQVVGRTGGVGFIWDSVNGMRDLNALLPAGQAADWEIFRAHGINDAGQIIADGRVPSGKVHAVLLTPYEPPVIADIPNGTAAAGQTYTLTPSLAQGDPVDTWELIAGPADAIIDSSSGKLTWPAPTIAGSPHTMTIRATNLGGSDDEIWELDVIDPAAAAGPCAASPPMLFLPFFGALLLLRKGTKR